MSARDIIIIIGAISLPTIGCWFGILAIRYSLFGLQPHKKVVKILKVFTLQFIYISAVLWTIIYVSLGYASYRVFDCMRASGNGFDGEAKIAFTLYLVQLILHWAWIPIFVKFEPCYGVSKDKLIELCWMLDLKMFLVSYVFNRFVFVLQHC